MEQQEAELPPTAAGGEAKIDLRFGASILPLRLKFDLLRPNRFSAYSPDWKP